MAAPEMSQGEKAWSTTAFTPPSVGVTADEPVSKVEKDIANADTRKDENAGKKVVEDVEDEGDVALSRNELTRTRSNWTGTSGESGGEKKTAEGQIVKESRKSKLNPLKWGKMPPVPKEREVSREYTAGLLSKITFQWMSPLMNVGYRRPLQEKDLWTVNPDRSIDVLAGRLMSNFKIRVAKSDPNPLRKALYDTVKTEFLIGGVCAGLSSVFQVIAPYLLRYLIQFAVNAYLAQHGPPPRPAAPPIGHGIGIVIGISLMQIITSLCSNHFIYRGMTVGGQARAALIAVIFDKAMRLSGRARVGPTRMDGIPEIYLLDQIPKDIKPGTEEEKNWFKRHLPSKKKDDKKKEDDKKSAAAEDTQGWSNSRVVNLMSIDTYRIDLASGFFHMLWSSPISIVVCIILLLVNITYSALSGIGLIIIGMPLLGIVVKSLFFKRKVINKITDQRVGLTQEILQGVRFVKFFGWESSFLDRLAKIRKLEIAKVQNLLSIRMGIMAVGMSLPQFASMLAFITYSLSHKSIRVPAQIFSSLALFNALRMPLLFLPLVIGQVVDASASIRRIEDFLLAEEVDEAVKWDHDNKNAVVVSDASFTWEQNSARDEDPLEAKSKNLDVKALKGLEKSNKKAAKNAKLSSQNSSEDVTPEGKSSSSMSISEKEQKDEHAFEIQDISFTVGRNELVAVIGSVGSGKSSLLGALAGDMRKTKGEVTLGASRAFCPQYAWIQNANVKENIVFGKAMNRKFYNEVIDACALRRDLEMLPDGDLTEIGERGITVSGGQKQRLNIARAIYFDADIVLMDDPLSAVDAHVGRQIMDEAICGLLANKCRILATHQLHVLHRCDRIIWMQEGRIYKIDTFPNFMSQDLEFQKLMATTAVEEKTDASDAEEGDAEAAKDQNAAKGKKDGKKGRALMTIEDQAVASVGLHNYAAYIRATGTWLSAPIVLILLILYAGSNVVTNLWLSWWTSDKFGYSTGLYVSVFDHY